MKSISSLCLIPILILLAGAAPTSQPMFTQVVSPRDWSFPRDHGRHDGFKLEWWYFTGNMHDSAGRRFGYQLTFFRSAFSPDQPARPSPWGTADIYFGHAAISDIAGKTFVYKDLLERARPKLAYSSDQTMDVSLLDWYCKLDDGAIRLKSAEKDFLIDLTCTDWRGPVLEGPGGMNAKGPLRGQASYYYSMTRLKTAGTLTINGKSFTVEGQSWMDHEFSSNALAPNQIGWDWMGLQLNDGTDLMIYRMRDRNGSSDYLSGTRITPDGQPHYLAAKDLTLLGSEPWKSPTSEAIYPQRWTVMIAGQTPLTITTEMPGQELVTTTSTHVTYFEGASRVTDESGHVVGDGYLEMTGYVK